MEFEPIIEGLCLAGYRSFGPERQYIAPLGKINLLAGPNNSGKSNILRYLKKHLRSGFGVKGEQFKRILDQHQPLIASPIQHDCGLGLSLGSPAVKGPLANVAEPRQRAAELLLQSESIYRDGHTLFTRTSADIEGTLHEELDANRILTSY